MHLGTFLINLTTILMYIDTPHSPNSHVYSILLDLHVILVNIYNAENYMVHK